MLLFGVDPHILALNSGDESVVQDSANTLIRSGAVHRVSDPTKITMLSAIFKLFLKNPRRTLTTFRKAYSSKLRWLYFKSSPYAYYCLRSKVDYIHAHFADVNFIFASMLSEWSGVQYGVTTHGYDLRGNPIPIDDAVRCFNQAALVVTISEFNRRFMVDKLGLTLERIKVIHCGIDTDKFEYTDSISRFEKPILRFITVGRLVPEKAQENLLQAFSEVQKRGVGFQLTIIGDGPLREGLEKLCRFLCIEECVDFIGAQPQAVVIDLLQKADVFVLSSRSEGLPVVCMEAMATGTLIIATRINGIPELIEDHKNGLLVEAEDISGLADAICWVDKNRTELKAMSLAARKVIERDFNRRKCSELLLGSINSEL